MSLPSYYITDAAVIGHGVLRLTFADGTSGEVDVLDHGRPPKTGLYPTAHLKSIPCRAGMDREVAK